MNGSVEVDDDASMNEEDFEVDSSEPVFWSKFIEVISKPQWNETQPTDYYSSTKLSKMITKLFEKYFEDIKKKERFGRHKMTPGFDHWIWSQLGSWPGGGKRGSFLKRFISSVYHLASRSNLTKLFALLAGIPIRDYGLQGLPAPTMDSDSTEFVFWNADKRQEFEPYLFHDYFVPYIDYLIAATKSNSFGHLYGTGRTACLVDKNVLLQGVGVIIKGPSPYEHPYCLAFQKHLMSIKLKMCPDCKALKSSCKISSHEKTVRNSKVVTLSKAFLLIYPACRADAEWRENLLLLRLVKKLQRLARRFLESRQHSTGSNNLSRPQEKLDSARKLDKQLSEIEMKQEKDPEGLYPGEEDDGFGADVGENGNGDFIPPDEQGTVDIDESKKAEPLDNELYEGKEADGFGGDDKDSGLYECVDADGFGGNSNPDLSANDIQKSNSDAFMKPGPPSGKPFDPPSNFKDTESRPIGAAPHSTVWRVTGENGAKVRATPDVNSAEVGQLKCGDLVELGEPEQEYQYHPLVMKGRRVHVINPLKGYVSKVNADGSVRILTKEKGLSTSQNFTETKTPMPGSTEGSTIWRVIGENGAKVRETPDINSAEVGQIHSGDLVELAFPEPEWQTHPLVQCGRRVHIVKPIKGYVSKQNKDGSIHILTQEFQAGVTNALNTYNQQTLPSGAGVQYNSAEDAVRMMAKMDKLLELQLLLHEEFKEMKGEVDVKIWELYRLVENGSIGGDGYEGKK